MSVRFGAIAMAIGGVSALVGVAAVQDADSSWPTYGGTPANLKYAPLDQIDRTNAGALKIAWRWRSIDEDTKPVLPTCTSAFTRRPCTVRSARMGAAGGS